MYSNLSRPQKGVYSSRLIGKLIRVLLMGTALFIFAQLSTFISSGEKTIHTVGPQRLVDNIVIMFIIRQISIHLFI